MVRLIISFLVQGQIEIYHDFMSILGALWGLLAESGSHLAIKIQKKVCVGFKQACLKSNRDSKIYVENFFLLNVILHNIKEAY